MNRIGPIQLFAEIKRRENRVTYRGLDTESGRIVLVKIFAPTSVPGAAAVVRFQQEAAIYASLDHPNVVKLVKFGVADNRPYLALEFIEGQNLRALLLQRSPLPNDIAICIALSLLAGLAEIHRHEIIHRDLKPENVMIGSDCLVKICDFDFALSGSDNSIAERLSGTPGYFSPEAILGEPLTTRSDLFALGIILYEMFTGARPFAAPTASGEMYAVIRVPHLTPAKLNNMIPEEIEQLINRLLAKSPAERPESAAVILGRLMEKFPVPADAQKAQTLQRFLDNPSSYQSAAISLPPAMTIKPAAARTVSTWRIAAVGAFVVLTAAIVYQQLLAPTRASKNDRTAMASETKSGADSLLLMVEKKNPNDGSPPRPTGLKAQEEKTAAVPVPAAETEIKTPRQRAVVVRSVPWAYLFVNGDSIGQAPRTTPPLRMEQDHLFAFKKPKFPDLAYSVKIDSATADTLVFSLWERVAQVEIRINPWAEFYLNGALQESSAKNPSLVLLPGKYHFRFKNPGLGEKIEAIFLQAGETRRLEVNMFQRQKN